MSILYTVVICSEELPIASLTVQQLSDFRSLVFARMSLFIVITQYYVSDTILF